MDYEKEIAQDAEFDYEQNLTETDAFFKEISGVNHFGTPNARLLLRLGGPEDHSAKEAEIGPVILNKRNLQGCYMIDLQFQNREDLGRCHKFMEDYAKYIDINDGFVDPEHTLSVILMENQDYVSGYAIAQFPVFFAQTAAEPGGICDSYRMAFRRDCLFYFDIDQINRDEDPENKPFVF